LGEKSNVARFINQFKTTATFVTQLIFFVYCVCVLFFFFALADELESVRSLFMEKEKELAIAVAKVESLTQQLDKQRQGWSQTSPSREKTHQQLELERLRKELMVRRRDTLTLETTVTQVLYA